MVREDCNHTIDSQLFDNTLSYSDQIAVALQVVDEYPGHVEQLQINAANEVLLRAENVITDQIPDSDEYAELAPQFARLDSKLNLILELLATITAQQNDCPPHRSVRLSSTCIGIATVDQDPEFQLGTLVQVDLFIKPEVPKPLKLIGQVADTQPEQLVVSFAELNSGVELALQKLVFRHHRREIAERTMASF